MVIMNAQMVEISKETETIKNRNYKIEKYNI